MKIEISEDFDGRTVKDLLYHKSISRGTITRLKKIPNGITLNGKHITVRGVLKRGDVLNLMTDDLPADENEYLIPQKTELDIIYEDEDILAVNKPPNMPTHTSLGHPTDTLANGVAYYFSSRGIPFVFRAVNRLDRDTSGVVLLAKNRISAARLTSLLQAGKIQKRYLAALNGRLFPSDGKITESIRRKPDSIMLREVCLVAAEGAKSALTEYKTLWAGDGLSVVSAEPITGRTHQLRVHFASKGCPIVGDGLYGGREDSPTEYDKLMGRQALHALSLTVDFGEKLLSLTAPVPKDMTWIFEYTDISELVR